MKTRLKQNRPSTGLLNDSYSCHLVLARIATRAIAKVRLFRIHKKRFVKISASMNKSNEAGSLLSSLLLCDQQPKPVNPKGLRFFMKIRPLQKNNALKIALHSFINSPALVKVTLFM